MGGGKKKVTLSQMERSQDKKPDKKKESKSSSTMSERKVPQVFMPDVTSGKLVEEVKKLKVLTPYAVASRYNLRLSVAKDFLEELEKRGAVQRVSRSRNVLVYKAN